MPSPEERAYPAHWEADVVLRDGGTARVRPITPDDAERLVSFYEQVSDESKYYRFFAPYPRLSDKDVRRFTHHDYVDRVGLAATVGGEFIATVRYDRIDELGRPAAELLDEAEVAFLVRDDQQGRGVASALLEHIGAVARERGIRRFAAEVLPANTKMIKVFTDAGYSQKRSFEDGSVHLTLDLEPTERSLAVMRAREQRAEARSVARLLAPGSVAVVGASRTPAAPDGPCWRACAPEASPEACTRSTVSCRAAPPAPGPRAPPSSRECPPTALWGRSPSTSTSPSSPFPPRAFPPSSPSAARPPCRASSSSPTASAATNSASWCAWPAPTGCAWWARTRSA